MRVDARRQGKRHGLEAVPLIVEVVSVSFARKDYEYCTEKHGCYSVPVFVAASPYAGEVIVHTQPTGSGYLAAHTYKYGPGNPRMCGAGPVGLVLLLRTAQELPAQYGQGECLHERREHEQGLNGGGAPERRRADHGQD